MAQSQLPAECISCIISHLDGDLTTLFRLLTVNSTFFRATLPYLYRDPYRTLERREAKRVRRQGGYPSSICGYVATKRLLYLLLLSCRQGDDLVPFLNVDWDEPLSPFVSDQPLMACYIDYLGDLDFDRWTATLKLLMPEFDTQIEQYAFRLFRLLFLDHHKERVQKLAIPITHIEPYMDLLPHLRNLQRVRFYVDELEQPPQERSHIPEDELAAEPAAELAAGLVEELELAAVNEEVQVAEVPDIVAADALVAEVEAAPVTQDIEPTVDPVANLTPEPAADPLTEPAIPEPTPEPAVEPVEAPTVEATTVEPMADQPIAVVEETSEENYDAPPVPAEKTLDEILDEILAESLAADAAAYVWPEPVLLEEQTFDEALGGFMAIEMDYVLPERAQTQDGGEDEVMVEGDAVAAEVMPVVAVVDETIAVPAVVEEVPVEEEGDGMVDLAALPAELEAVATAEHGPAVPIYDHIYEIESEVMLRMFTESTRIRDTGTSEYEPEEAMAYILALVGDPEEEFEPESAMADILFLLGDPEGHDQFWETTVLESEEAQEEEEVAPEEEVVPVEEEVVVVPEEVNDVVLQEQEQTPAQEETPEEPAQPAPPVFDPTPDGVKFLQAHAELFGPGPGRVGPGLVEIEPPYSWIHPSDSENITYSSRYVELLKAQSNPTIIQFHHWERFRHYLKDTPVQSVKRLRSFYEEWPEAGWDQAGLLKKCRSLEKFSSRIFDPTLFEFAIEEQQDRDIYEELCKAGVAGASTSLGGGRSHGGHYGPGEDPIPLRKVNLISYRDGFLHPVLQNICTAFMDSLESIVIRLFISDDALPLSQFCYMSQLTVLDLRHDCPDALTNDTFFLSYCPSLKTLRLRDGKMEQPLIIQTPCALKVHWHLPCLEELVLVGSACDLFNYESLAYSPRLQSLRLECIVPDMGVHVVDEMYQEYLTHPSWNWTWKLPRLHTLLLKGRPAHLFRPCLLLGCPKLTNVHLDVGRVSRSVTSARDALSTTPSTFNSPVRSLTLKGYWFMNSTATTVTDFFQTWFSSLTYLKFESTVFFDNRSMLDGLYSIPTLRKVFLCRQTISEYDAWKLGLEGCPLKSPFEWERKTRHISFQAELQRLRLVVKKRQAEAEEKEAQARALILEVEAEEAKAKAAAAVAALQSDNNVTTPAFVGSDVSVDNNKDNKPEPTPTTDRVRCQSVDSAIALEEEQAQAAEQAKLAKEDAENDRFESLRCVYVFKNMRYHRGDDTPQDLLLSCSL
ncbi:hypothetical protein KI688_006429 [Linnemannia hyalina]|uniref:F-box domain-containing protein n=1 Tax=Linnemannia hyalina TaxID=64524 RepID=A0A9P8BXP3_9FUNG|nr:hypothetical protein KI688_006429 [Linnemannia hyalina]